MSVLLTIQKSDFISMADEHFRCGLRLRNQMVNFIYFQLNSYLKSPYMIEVASQLGQTTQAYSLSSQIYHIPTLCPRRILLK